MNAHPGQRQRIHLEAGDTLFCVLATDRDRQGKVSSRRSVHTTRHCAHLAAIDSALAICHLHDIETPRRDDFNDARTFLSALSTLIDRYTPRSQVIVASAMLSD